MPFKSSSPRDLLAVARRLRDSVVYTDALLLKWKSLGNDSNAFIKGDRIVGLEDRKYEL